MYTKCRFFLVWLRKKNVISTDFLCGSTKPIVFYLLNYKIFSSSPLDKIIDLGFYHMIWVLFFFKSELLII